MGRETAKAAAQISKPRGSVKKMTPSSLPFSSAFPRTFNVRIQRWLTCGNLKHVACLGLYVAIVWAQLNVFGVFRLGRDDETDDNDQRLPSLNDVFVLGPFLAFVLFINRYLVCTLSLFCVFNFLGMFLFSLFPPKPRILRSLPTVPFCCFRVVTRGTFPELVRQNVEKNLAVCSSLGLQNFLFEVVTDAPIAVPQSSRIREVLVPTDYRTRNGSLFKARALQYSLEPGVNILSDRDWIIHLDEETLLTSHALAGIINFVAEGRYHFGQGVIYYSKIRIVNWMATLADSVRVGVDYGALRFALKVLHKPFFSWKGSFVVANAGAEKSISFDHGPEASVAEDCFFAMVAFQRGYSFGFVDGEMLEQSAFTMKDYVQQRQRWMKGIFMVAKSRQLAWRYKLGPVLMTIPAACLPFTVLDTLLNLVWPVSLPPHLGIVLAFVTSTLSFLFLIGTLKSFSCRRYGVLGCLLLAVLTVLWSFVNAFFDVAASVLAFWWSSSRPDFHIVRKDLETCIV